MNASRQNAQKVNISSDVASASVKANSARAPSRRPCVRPSTARTTSVSESAAPNGLISARPPPLRGGLNGRFGVGAVRIIWLNYLVIRITGRSRAGDRRGSRQSRNGSASRLTRFFVENGRPPLSSPRECQRVDPIQRFGGSSRGPRKRPLRVGEKPVLQRSRTLACDSTSSVVFSSRPTRCRGAGFRASAGQRCARRTPRRATGWDSE